MPACKTASATVVKQVHQFQSGHILLTLKASKPQNFCQYLKAFLWIHIFFVVLARVALQTAVHVCNSSNSGRLRTVTNEAAQLHSGSKARAHLQTAQPPECQIYLPYFSPEEKKQKERPGSHDQSGKTPSKLINAVSSAGFVMCLIIQSPQ